MTSGPRRSPGAVGMGALALGLLTTPWAYVFVGALSRYPPSFTAVVAPLLTIATIYLLKEAFTPFRGFERVRWAGAVAAVAVVFVSLWYLTNFTLLTQIERVSLFATLWLGASLFWLLVSLPFRAFGPEARLSTRLISPVSRRVALVTALLLLVALSVLAWRYLTTPAQFIGGPTSTEIG